MMTGTPPNGPGRRADKVVRKVLADGTVKEYRYARHKARARQPNGVIRELADAYTSSPEFGKLSARWQAAKHYYLKLLDDELGWMSREQLEDQRARRKFYEMRDRFAGKPHKADKLIDTLKGLLSWAAERARLKANHALGMEHLTSSKGERANIVWSEDDEAVVGAAFPLSLQQAFRFALYSAIRQADMCALRWSQYRDGWLSFTPSKTSGSTAIDVHLPVAALPPFADLMDELSRGTEFILTTEEGQPWNPVNLRARWRSAMAKKMPGRDLHWHDIRGTALSRMADAGCTDSERAAISGHSLGGGKLADYTARSKQLALNAYVKWARYIAQGPEVVSLETFLDNRKLALRK
jgi:integrase